MLPRLVSEVDPLANWLLSEVAIGACDLAEVLGSAVALNLLFHIPLLWAVVITAFDVLLLLALQGLGMRFIEAVILVLVAERRLTGWAILPALIILCREILVSGLREYLAGLHVSVPVSQLAKWKTMLQMLALGFLILGDGGAPHWPISLIGEIGLWAAAALTLVTGYDYLKAGLKHM